MNNISTILNSSTNNEAVPAEQWIRLSSLGGLRVGIDAQLFFRELDRAKPDIFRRVIGGVGADAVKTFHSILSVFERMQIKPIWVFPGMVHDAAENYSKTPIAGMVNETAKCWNGFYSDLDRHTRQNYVNTFENFYGADAFGFKPIFRKLYDGGDTEVMRIWMHSLKTYQKEVIVAPNHTAAQLSYMQFHGLIDFVIAPLGSFLFPGLDKIGHEISFQYFFRLSKSEEKRPATKSANDYDEILLAVSSRHYYFDTLGLKNGFEDQKLFTDAMILAKSPDIFCHFLKNKAMLPYGSENKAVELLQSTSSGGLISIINALIGTAKPPPTEDAKAPKPYQSHFQQLVATLTPLRAEEVEALIDFKANCLGKIYSSIYKPLVFNVNGKACHEVLKPTPNNEFIQSCLNDKTPKRRIPELMYQLLNKGWISPCLLTTLQQGFWPLDSPGPTIAFSDVASYEVWLNQLPLRRRMIGLLAQCMHPSFMDFTYVYYPRTSDIAKNSDLPEMKEQLCSLLNASVSDVADCHKGLKWEISEEFVTTAYQRSITNSNSHQMQPMLPLPIAFAVYSDLVAEGKGRSVLSMKGLPVLTAPITNRELRLRQFYVTTDLMVMENLGYFTSHGQLTFFGNFLCHRVPTDIFSDFLVLVEMIKQGHISHEYPELKTASEFKPRFVPNGKTCDFEQELLLLTRVFSIFSLRWSHMYKDTKDLDFDLSLFSGSVNIVRRHIKMLTETCASSLLLRHPDLLAPVDQVEKHERAVQEGSLPPERELLEESYAEAVYGKSFPPTTTPSSSAKSDTMFCAVAGKYRKFSTFSNNLGGVFMKAILLSQSIIPPEGPQNYLLCRFIDWVDVTWSTSVMRMRLHNMDQSNKYYEKERANFDNKTKVHWDQIILNIFNLVQFWCLFKELICASQSEFTEDGSALRKVTESAHTILCNKLEIMGFFKTAKFQEMDELFRKTLGMPSKNDAPAK